MKPPEAWKCSLYYEAGEGKLPGAFLQLLAQATCVPFHGARKGVEICVTYRKFLTHRHLIPPCSTKAFFFQRAVAVVNVAGHISGVIAELHREVLPTRVPQLAVLSLAGTRGAHGYCGMGPGHGANTAPHQLSTPWVSCSWAPVPDAGMQFSPRRAALVSSCFHDDSKVVFSYADIGEGKASLVKLQEKGMNSLFF